MQMELPAFHSGYIVRDLAEAMERLADALGLTWAAVESHDFPIRQDGSEATYPIRFTYSFQGPPHVELVEGAPGSPWHTTEMLRMHHLGFWSDDMNGDAARLAAAGFPVVAQGIGGRSSTPRFTYSGRSGEVLLELVTSRSRQAMERWLAGGTYL